jgi:hypothetical protein
MQDLSLKKEIKIALTPAGTVPFTGVLRNDRWLAPAGVLEERGDTQ